MNKNWCTSLRIVYEVSGRYEVAYISEFFKLCGILVTEQEIPKGIASYKQLTENCRAYDRILFIGIEQVDFQEYFDMDCRKNSELITRWSYDPNFENHYKNNDFQVLYTELFKIVSNILNCNNVALSDFVSIYVYKNYCRLSYVKRYFSKNANDSLKEELYRGFLEIVRGIEEIVDKDRDIFPYVLYARVLCAKKVNDLCGALQWNYYFRPTRMIDKCLEIVNYAGCFPSAYALAAAFCCCETSFRASVLPFYEKALGKNRNHPALGSVYYKLGQYYEKFINDMVNANKIYEKALSLEPENFRFLFKRGSRLLDEKKYQSAINTYKRIVEVLDCKRKSRQLFPVEYEYLCKCYLLIGLIYDFHWADELQGSVYYKKAINLVEQELEESKFFKNFLGDKDGILIDYLKKGIALREHILVEKYK